VLCESEYLYMTLLVLAVLAPLAKARVVSTDNSEVQWAPPSVRGAAAGPARPAAAPAKVAEAFPAVLPLAAALANAPAPALADDFDIVGTVVNVGLTGATLGFAAFIGKFALEAAGEMGNYAGKVIEYDREMEKQRPKGKKPKQTEPVYDDSGSGAVSDAQVRKEMEVMKKKGRGSLQKAAGGVKFAPWLDIDEDGVAKVKAEREKRKKRESGESGKDSSSGMPWR